jgi:hypothetical protein
MWHRADICGAVIVLLLPPWQQQRSSASAPVMNEGGSQCEESP